MDQLVRTETCTACGRLYAAQTQGKLLILSTVGTMRLMHFAHVFVHADFDWN